MTTQNPATIPATVAVDILVFDKRIKNWKKRTTVTVPVQKTETATLNFALKNKTHGYGVSGTRPRMGEADSKSGRRFRAVLSA